MICMQGGADRGSGGRRRYMAGSHVLKPCSRGKDEKILSSTGTSFRGGWKGHATEVETCSSYTYYLLDSSVCLIS